MHSAHSLFGRWKLYHLLYFFKHYPTLRNFAVLTHQADHRYVLKTMKRRTAYLADRMRSLVDLQWELRHEQPNPVSTLFPGVSCILDTFPVRGTQLVLLGFIDRLSAFAILVRRPRDREWRSATRQGKYKDYVLKFQVHCTAVGYL